MTDTDYNDQEVQLLLIGDDNEINSGIVKLHNAKSLHILRIIKRFDPSLTSHDLMDVYQETMAKLIDRIKRDDFNPPASLLPYVATIARNIIRDRWDKADVRSRKDDEIKAIAERLQGSIVGIEWEAASVEERQRTAKIIRDVIAKMPDRQKQVATVWMDFFPDIPSWAKIAGEVRQRYKCVVTAVAAESAWKYAKEKIAEALKRQGISR